MAERTAYDRPPTEAGRHVTVTAAAVADRPWGRLWGPIVYGAFVGFAVTLLTGVFALAAGLTASGVVAEDVEQRETGYVPGPTETQAISQNPPQAEQPGLDPEARQAAAEGARTVGIGAGLWWIVSSILVGLAGGFAAGRMAEFIPRIWSFSVVVWTTGWLILLTLGAFGAGSASGLTMGLGQMAGQMAGSAGAQAGQMTGEAVGYTSAFAWLLFLNMLISLGATMLGVRMGRRNRWKAWESETAAPSPAH